MKSLIAIVFALVLVSCQKTPSASSHLLLEGNWKFVGYKDHKTCETPNEKVTIAFSKENGEIRANGRSFINGYFSDVEIETTSKSGDIKFNALGSTKMAGPEAEMNCEQLFFETLDAVTNFEVKGSELILKSKSSTDNTKPQTMTFKRM